MAINRKSIRLKLISHSFDRGAKCELKKIIVIFVIRYNINFGEISSGDELAFDGAG